MSNSNSVKISFRLYPTRPHDCSYLPDEVSTTIFVDPNFAMNNQIYGKLLSLGFRRSETYVYKPHCDACSECISLRLPVNHFYPNRSQRRTWKKNSDLHVVEVPAIFNDHHFQLYSKYISARHKDGDMFPPSEEHLNTFLSCKWSDTRAFEFRLSGDLLAVMLTDFFSEGISAVYTFFDPDDEKRSLGTYAVLWLLQEAYKRQLEHVYLGYWIRDCPKMNYKTQYQLSEILKNKEWVVLEDN